MKIYLDTNIYFRSLDDKRQTRIALEAEASLVILELVINGRLTICGSDILMYEINQANQLKQSYIMPFTKYWQSQIHLSTKIITDAELIQRAFRLKGRDALHLTFAAMTKSKFLLTCDDEFIVKTRKYVKIKVINPLDFIKEIL